MFSLLLTNGITHLAKILGHCKKMYNPKGKSENGD